MLIRVAALVVVASLCGLAGDAGAASPDYAISDSCTPGTSFSTEVDPDNVELDRRIVVSPPALELGPDARSCVLVIRNRHPERITVRLEARGLIGARGAQSSVAFLGPEDERFDETAASWLDPRPATFELPPRGVARVPIHVEVDAPEAGGAASAFGTIDVIPETDSKEGGQTVVGVESRIAIPFLFQLDLEADPKLRLSSMHAPRLRWDRDPWTLRASIDNRGDLHDEPRGSIRVRSIFGSTVAKFDIDHGPLLPGGRVRIEETWDEVPWFGFYRYEVRVEGASGGAGSDRVTGWFVALPPWWVLAISGLLVFVAIGGVVQGRRGGVEQDWDEDDMSSSDGEL